MRLDAYVCNLFHCTIDEMQGKTRIREAVSARQIMMSILREYTAMSFPEIGSYFNRDHATVMHSIRTVRNLYTTNRPFREKVDSVYDAINDGRVEVPYSRIVPVADYLDEDAALYASLV